MSATLDVAVYVLHVLRATTQDDLARRLVGNAQQLYRRGVAAGRLRPRRRALESARLIEEPPTTVREAKDAISWLSRALIELGLVYEEKQRPDIAAVLYERCLRIEPEQADVARRLNAIRSSGADQPKRDT